MSRLHKLHQNRITLHIINNFDEDQFNPDQNTIRGVVTVQIKDNPNKISRCGQVICKRYVDVTGLENADKTASMETVQPHGGRVGLAAAARIPHQWKRNLNLIRFKDI